MYNRFVMAGIPAWNAEETISSVVKRTKQYVDLVVVVDDGSKDKTALVSKEAGAMVVKHKHNIGYGGAIQSIFKKARQLCPDILVILDSDGQHNPDEIPYVLEPVLSKKVDISIGSRFVFNQESDVPACRALGIKILNFVTRLIGPNVEDSQSGFRAYSKNAIEAIKPSQNGMTAGAEILIQAHGRHLGMTEVPISCTYDNRSSTKNPITHGLEVMVSLLLLSLSDRVSTDRIATSSD